MTETYQQPPPAYGNPGSPGPGAKEFASSNAGYNNNPQPYNQGDGYQRGPGMQGPGQMPTPQAPQPAYNTNVQRPLDPGERFRAESEPGHICSLFIWLR